MLRIFSYHAELLFFAKIAEILEGNKLDYSTCNFFSEQK